jgi:hypothetical protein
LDRLDILEVEAVQHRLAAVQHRLEVEAVPHNRPRVQW